MDNDPLVPRAWSQEDFNSAGDKEKDSFTPLAFAKPSWEEAVKRFKSAGVIDVDKNDSELFTAYKRSVDYLSDMGLSGLELSDAAFKAAIGLGSELVPFQSDSDERRLQDDLYAMPEAFMGVSPVKVKAMAKKQPLFNKKLYEEEDFKKVPAESLKKEPEEIPDFYLLESTPTPQEGLKILLDSAEKDVKNPEVYPTFAESGKSKITSYEKLGEEKLLDLSQNLPHFLDKKYSDYQDKIASIAKSIGVNKEHFTQLINDLSNYYPQKVNPELLTLTEGDLPFKTKVGVKQGKNVKRPNEEKAENLGFKEVVYHVTSSPKEFNIFDPDKSSGWDKTELDLLGVHVGTARAAAERNYNQVFNLPKGELLPAHTMELRVRTDKPLTKGKAAELIGKKAEDIFQNPDAPFTEAELLDFVKALGSSDIDYQDQAKEVRKRLSSEGFTHIPYINDIEDAGSTSYIMLVDRPKDSPAVVRDIGAEFDKDKIKDLDLRFSEGGIVSMEKQMSLFEEGGMVDQPTTIFDMTPEEFNLYLQEMQPDAKRRKFLTEEYSKRNTLSGQMKSVLQETTDLPEGRKRANILPMTKPEGMTGLEAIRSGEAEWALPGMLTDVAGEVLTATETGEKVSKGLPVSEEDLTQAAFTGAGLGAAGSTAFTVPEGSVRIFGGFKGAESPGYGKSGTELPKSVGREGLERFEIDDSESVVLPENLKTISNGMPTGKGYSYLDEVLIHDELYFQYPEIKELSVVIDENLTGTRVQGYHDSNRNLIGIRADIASDPKKLRSTLLHELQHEVQGIEDFDPGTSPKSPRILQKLVTNENYNQDVKDFKDFNKKKVTPTVKKIVELLPENDTLKLNLESSLSKVDDITYRFNGNLSDDFYALAKDYPDIFEEVFYMDAKDFIEVVDPYELQDFFVNQGILKKTPLDVDYRKPISGEDRYNLYSQKAGEVEARNVSKRKDMPLEERFRKSPESTEGLARKNQWTEYSEGGMVTMEKQMSLFEEGGMADDGMEQDPISGNDIPPGSTAEEVRDDIDAKLSEGEYVVPADVVQYFGLKFFENLRAEAKGDLEKMEGEGRIGGQSLEEEEELSPEEMQMLQEVMGEKDSPDELRMAEGGMVKPSFDPTQWATVGASSAPVGQGSSYKTYYGPSGESRMILFVNGKPTTPIPKGFTEKPAATTPEAVSTPQVRTTSNEELLKAVKNEEVVEGKSWAEKNKDALMSDPVSFGLEQLQSSFMDKAITAGGMALAGPIVGGVAGKALQLNNINQAKAARDIAAEQNRDVSDLDEAIDKAEKSMGVFSGIGGLLGFDGSKFKSGWDSLTKDKTPDAMTSTPVSRPRDGGNTQPTGGQVTTTGGTGGSNYGTATRSGSAAPTQSSRPQSRSTSNLPSTATNAPSKADTQKATKEYSGGYGYKQGGLVKRKKTC